MSVIARNMISLLASQVAAWCVSAVMLVVVPNYLRDTNLGRHEFVLTYTGFFALVGLLGTNSFIIKTTARDHSRVGALVLNGVMLKLAMSAALTASAFGLGALLGFSRQSLLLLGAACLAMTLRLINDVLVAGLNGMERMARPAMWGVVAQYVGAAFGLVAIVLDRGLVAFAYALVPAGAIPIVANFINLRPQLRGGSKLDPRLWRTIAVGGLPYLAWAAILSVYGSIDLVMLRPLAGSATVGWYALALKWVGLPVIIAGTVLTALFPSLSASSVHDPDRFSRVANKALMLVAFVALPLAAGIALVVGDVFEILYGSKFDNTVPLIRIICLHIPVVATNMIIGMVLFASDRQRQWVLVGCVAAVLNPVLNIFAIPFARDHFENGAIGAAVTTILTEVVMTVGGFRLRPPGVLDRWTAGYMLRCFAATLAMVAVVLALGDVPLAVTIVVGIAAFAVSSIVFRTASRDNLGTITDQVFASIRARGRTGPSTNTE
jgi:O-antigen/teichoic acid export membrane protein